MKIKINLVSGQVYEFELPIERPIEFLNKIRPMELFSRPLHQFLGKMVTVSINPELIEWIELDTSEFPTVASPIKSLTLRQLSAEAFRHWLDRQKEAIKASMENDGKHNVLLAYGQAIFKSGRSLFFEMRSKLERIEDRVRASQKIFSMPALFVYGESTGLFIVNPKNIAVWKVVPGLKESGHFAIHGELTGIRKS